MKRLAALFCLLPSLALAQPVFNHVDTNQDNRVSRLELEAERMKRFERLDANNDTIIDRAELFDAGLDADAVQAFLTLYDLDMDGRIALWEVVDSMERTDIFSNLDLDQDGYLTREEAAPLMNVTVGGGIAQRTILDDLSQGRRTREGFLPIRRQLPNAPAAAIPTLGPNDLMPVPAQNRSNPTIQARPFDLSNGMGDMNTPLRPAGREGYVARTRNTEPAGMPMWMENSRPPEGPIRIHP